MRRIMLVRVGWMTYYAGAKPGDEQPVGGGKQNLVSVGGEITLFKKRNGRLYASFGFTATDEGLNFSRIDPSAGSETLKRVLLVFFAKDPRPESSGQVVVGWYRDAELLRWHTRKPFFHVASTLPAKGVLLPSSRRTIVVPRGRGATGQANNFYLLDSRGRAKRLPWVKHILELVDNYDGPNLLADPKAEAFQDVEAATESAIAVSHGQGMAVDAASRKVIEQAAMRRAIRDFAKQGYDVQDVSSPRSYDLHCTKNGNTLLVEVKGTQIPLSSILLTPNEVALARRKKNLALFVLHSVRLRRNRKLVTATGGKSVIIHPWRPDRKGLKAIAWQYTFDSTK